ncbi:MAG: T9SS type A sorting domain-containing protein [Ignavibacteria bacterium]|nr:T9SS type A sorting domain-containing protein [Ignavibacteria bacterium]
MKKLFWIFSVLAIFQLQSHLLFSQKNGLGMNNQGNRNSCKFVDSNGDGIRDNFIDLNKDGRCDFGKGVGKGKGYERGKNLGKGNGICLRNFTDANNDGVCDNYQNKVFLSKPYPNPFSSNTNFELTIPKSGEVIITLSDLMGNVVKTIFQGNLEKGTHKFTLNSQNLTPGRYILVAKFDGNTVSKQVHFKP